MAALTPAGPFDEAERPPAPAWSEEWLTEIDDELAAITPTEHHAALDQILTAAGYERDENARLRRTRVDEREQAQAPVAVCVGITNHTYGDRVPAVNRHRGRTQATTRKAFLMPAIGIGFIPLPGSTTEATREKARAVLDEFAQRESVALRHVIEPPGTNPDQIRASMSTLEDVASMHGARTLVVFGAVTEEILDLTRKAELRLIAVPDPTRRRSASDQSQTPAETSWLGQLEVDLVNGRHRRVKTIDLDVQADTIALAITGRPLAQLNRLRFREWLHNPTEPLKTADVVWSVQDGITCVTIEKSVPCIVPTDTVDQLVKVI